MISAFTLSGGNPNIQWLGWTVALASCSIWIWMGIKDTTARFKCYRRKVLESIDLRKIRFMGYAFQVEMKYTAHLHGFKLVEVPITFVDRVLGSSKMSAKIFKEAFFGVFLIKGKEL